MVSLLNHGFFAILFALFPLKMLQLETLTSRVEATDDPMEELLYVITSEEELNLE